MFNRIRNILDSRMTVYSVLIGEVCMLGWTIPLKIYGEWTAVSEAAVLSVGVLLAIWIIWAAYALITKKQPEPMQGKEKLIVQSTCSILITAWFYIASKSIAGTLIWLLFWGWYEYRLISEYRESCIADEQ